MVQAIHKIQSYNLFISAGMIVGFDNDDPTIFDEQFNFLQRAGIPITMVSALMAVPKTPLYKRLKAERRLVKRTSSSKEPSQYAGTNGGTNFHPLHMTVEELKRGQQELCRRLYAPKAFAERLFRVGHDEGAVDGRAKFVPHANCPSGPSPGTAPQTLISASRTP